MIQFVCTGKGTHRVVDMRRFSLVRSEDYWGKGWREIVDHAASRLKDSYAFRCRRCGRETRMTAQTLRTVLDGLQVADREWLDVSRLPF